MCYKLVSPVFTTIQTIFFIIILLNRKTFLFRKIEAVYHRNDNNGTNSIVLGMIDYRGGEEQEPLFVKANFF